jgi:hypothetical protein
VGREASICYTCAFALVRAGARALVALTRKVDCGGARRGGSIARGDQGERAQIVRLESVAALDIPGASSVARGRRAGAPRVMYAPLRHGVQLAPRPTGLFGRAIPDRVLLRERWIARRSPREVHVLRSALVCLVISGCAANSTGVDSASITCPPDSTLTYENFGQPLVVDHCLSCHATSQRPALATQPEIQSNRQAILKVAVETTQMPKGSAMGLDERQLLGEWLACGAP